MYTNENVGTKFMYIHYVGVCKYEVPALVWVLCAAFEGAIILE